MLQLLTFARARKNNRMPIRKLFGIIPTLILCISATSAHAAIIDFDSLETATGGILTTSNPYTEDGFKIFGSPLKYFSQDNFMYAGSAGLLVAASGGTAALVQSGGLGFSLNSIDLSFIDPVGTSPSITFTGLTTANTLVSQSLTPVGFGFTQFNFNSTFASVRAVYWKQGTNSRNGHQFDNINVTSIPEPGTVGLLSLALLGLAFARRRKAD